MKAGASSTAGFTMLELSVVLVIVAIITAIGINSSLGVLEGAKRTSTENKINAIEKALMAYRLKMNRLPCPGSLTLTSSDPNYGAEASNPGVCYGGAVAATSHSTVTKATATMAEGSVPVKALNLPDEFMYDAWGRRIAYGVDVGATDYNAFSTIYPNESCGLTVYDGTGGGANSRAPHGAIYVLVSYGKDGVGGYLPNGTPIPLGGINANTDEKINYHSGGTYVGTYVQKDETGDLAAGTSVFDDIVHFKERWQMQSNDDYKNYSGYKGGHLAVGYVNAVGKPSAYIYQHQCGTWQLQSNLSVISPATLHQPIGEMDAIAFTQDNGYLMTYSEAGCRLFAIQADGTYYDRDVLGAVAAVGNCPAYATYKGKIKFVISNNGYMVAVSSVAPYLFLWKFANAGFVSLPLTTSVYFPGASGGYESTSGTLVNTAVAAPTMISISKNADYVAIANLTTLAVFKRTGDKLTKLPAASQPAPAAKMMAIAFSPNGKYFATLESAAVEIWPITDSATPFGTVFHPNSVTNMSPSVIAFSPDGKYLVVAGATVTGDNITIFSIDGPTTFTQLTNQSGHTYPTGWVNNMDTIATAIAFSSDSMYIALAITPGATHTTPIFRRVSPTEFKYIQDVHTYNSLGALPTASIAFIH